MLVLDAGCGPGSITTGIAAVVGASGAVIGVDINEAAVTSARDAASQISRANASFQTADVYNLPFGDATFDAALAHALLQHLADPGAALRELRRVLKPGAVIGVADADHDGSIMWPKEPLLDEWGRLLRALRAHQSGGDPTIGKRLAALLYEAGFERIVGSASSDSSGDPEATRGTALFWAEYLRSPELRAQVSSLGLATETKMDAMAEAWLRWGQTHGAFWASFWCQAAGWVPR
jgi:ubiquinone/menaquinone biosynthesis C-methylase UbiE